MAKTIPAYIPKDFTLHAADGGQRIGQASGLTVPVLEKTMESFRNAGMVKPREVAMGFEATTCSFEETALDPDMIRLFGIGAASRIVGYCYMEDEDGEEHALRIEMVCDVKQIDPGSWTVGGKASTSFDLAVHEGTMFIDDEEVIAFTDTSYRVGGEEQRPGRRAALRL